MKFQENEMIQLDMTLVYYTEDLKEDGEVSYQDLSVIRILVTICFIH